MINNLKNRKAKTKEIEKNNPTHTQKQKQNKKQENSRFFKIIPTLDDNIIITAINENVARQVDGTNALLL